MKKIFTLCFLMALVCVKGWGQTVTVLSQDFENGGSIPTGWASLQGGTGNKWTFSSPYGFSRSGSYCAEYKYNTTSPASAYLISPGVSLSAGTTYTILYYENTSGNYTEKIGVNVGKAQTVAAQTTVIQPATAYINTPYDKKAVTYTPSTSGTYYFSWICSSDADEYYLDLDDILITYPAPACTSPSAPMAVTLGTGTTTTQAGTITAPTTAPTGYLVVASTSSTLSAGPVNGTTYSAGSSIGGGKVQYVNTTASFTAATSLTSNTNYYYFVYSYNSGCTGAPYYSTTSLTGSKYTCIAAPTTLTTSSVTATSGTVTWTAPAGTITSYTINYGTTSGTYTNTTTSTTNSVTIPSLTAGTTYYYVVIANNSSNNSSCGTVGTTSAQGSFATTCATPSAPTSVTLGNSTTTTQAGTIMAPSTAPTGYLVVSSTSSTLSAGPANGTTYTAGTVLGGGTVQYVNTTASFTTSTALTSNTNYYYFVYSYNSGCTGAPYYSTTSATANKYTCIAAPTSLAAGSITTTSASLSWTAPAGTITSYNLKYGTTSGTYTTTLTGVTSPVSLTGLTAGTTYYYVIVANNSANNSSCTGSTTSAEANFTTLFTPPANDDCSGAVTMTPAGVCNSISGTTAGATQSIAATSACFSTSANDVWYKFTADGVSSYTINATTVGISDLVLGFYSGTCAALTSVSCSDGPAAGTETINTGVLSAGTYYYRIFGYNGASGTFTTCVTYIYCSSLYTTGCSAQDDINSITISNLSQTSTGCTGGTSYADYTSTNVTLLQGVNHTYTITCDYASGEYVGFWVDLNDNGSFTDAGEFMGGTTTASASTTITGSITLPSTAALGSHRMRVRLVYGSLQSLATACTQYGYGETHDYTAVIAAPAVNDLCPDAIALSLNTATTTTDVNAVYSTLSNDTYSSTYTLAGNGDVWYSFTACNAGSVTVSTASTPVQDLDLYVYSTSCPTDNNSKVASGTTHSTTSTTETTTFTATAGTKYYVRVAKYSGTSGTFTITATGSTTVIAPTSAAANASSYCVNAMPSTISLTATGGSGGTVTWYSGNCGGTLVGTGSPLVITAPTSTTTYYARYECGTNYSTCASVIVTVNSLPSAPTVTITQPTCATGTGTITVTAPTGTGITYSLDGGTYQGSTSFSGVAAGGHTIYVKNGSGCIASSAVTVNSQPATPATPTVTITQPTCTTATGTITITSPTGSGLTYSLDGGTYQSSVTFSGVAAGSHSITAYNGSCYSIATPVTINAQPATPAAPTVTITQPTCSVATATITVTAPTGAGITYSLDGGTYQSSTTFSSVATGSHTVTVYNGSCYSTATSATVNAQPPSPLVYNFATSSTTSCADDPSNQAQLTLENSETGVSYQLYRDNAAVVGSVMGTGSSLDFGLVTVTGTYKVIGTQGNCSTTMNGMPRVTVTTIANYTVSGSGTYCGQATITLSGSQTGVIYHLTGAASQTKPGTGSVLTFTVTISGTYSINATAGGCYEDMTGSATVTVNPIPTASIGGTTSICQNSTPVPQITFTGSGGTAPYRFTYTISGDPTIYTKSSGSGTTATVPAPTGTAGTYVYTLTLVEDANCSKVYSSNNTATVTVDPTSVAGTISGAGTVCTGTNSTPLTLSGNTGSIQWQSSANNVTFTDISGATSATYTATNLTATTYYRAVVTSGSCSSATTASVTVTVNPNASVGLVSGTSPLCIGATANYTANSVVLGGSGTGAWSSSTMTVATVSTTGVVTAIAAGTTNIIYTVTGGCGGTASAQQSLTVSPNAVAGTISGASTVCSGTNSTPLTLSGYTGTIQWQSSTDNTTFSNISGATSATYTATNLTATTYYRAVVTSGTCSAATTSSITVTVNQTPVASIETPSYTACDGSAPGVTFSGTANDTITYTITLQGGGNISTTPVLILANGDNVTVPAQTGQGVYTYTITSVSTGNGCPGTITNPSTTVTINPVPTVPDPITGPDFIAIGQNGSYTTTSTGGAWSIIGNPTGTATISSTTTTPDKAVVTGKAVGTATLIYTITDGNTGCSNAATKPLQVFDNTITRYRTKQDGYATNPDTWSKLNDNGVWVDANGYPNDNDNIEVRHNLSLLYADYKGVAGRSFVITDYDTTISGVSTNVKGTLTIAPTHYFQSDGSVNFNGRSVTLLSSKDGTAAIGNMPTPIAGATNVTVHRFTDGEPLTSATTSRRAWRLVTSPVTGQTIHTAWQEGAAQNAIPNSYGTLITGEGLNVSQAAIDSFDYVGGGNHTSIKHYVSSTNAWMPLSTGTAVSLQTEPAYMLFVRGNRSVSATGSTSATLRSTGTLQQGTQNSLRIQAGAPYTLVGNPYASAIDFGKFILHNTNLNDQFYSWNSTIGFYGAYVLVTHDGFGTNAGGYEATPLTMSGVTGPRNDDDYRYIPNGSGFFVSPATSSSTGTISFEEDDKAPGQVPPINPFRVVPDATNVRQLLVNLNLKDSDTSATLADGFRAKFSPDYEGNEEDNSSAKVYNFNENLNLVRNGKSHIIEARPDVQKMDTLYMKMWYVTKRNYQLQMQADNFTTAPGIQAWLVDNYSGTKQEISLSGNVVSFDFSVNSDSASAVSDRFRIVFENNAAVLPVTLTKISAQPKNGGAEVSWTVTNEINVRQYTIEKSTDGGGTFTGIGTQAAKNNTGAAITTYSGFDATPKLGDNLYRIRIEGKDGTVSYSEVVKVTIGNTGTGIQITIYPNPVREGKVSLQMTNLAAGAYLVSVYTSGGGQTVYQQKITITQGGTTQSEQLILGSGIAQGSYQLRIADNKGTTVYADKLVVGR